MTDKQAIDTHPDGLGRGEPREAGVNAAIVEAFLDDAAAAGLDIHGVMLHRAGRVVAEGWRWPYRAERPRIMHSATKSVMACAIGMALEEGRFGLQDKVVSFFPELLSGSIDAKLASMTVEHLLTMRAGHAPVRSGEASPPAGRLSSSRFRWCTRPAPPSCTPVPPVTCCRPF
jgi:CubicO group peptidase (beta-lactamase class C family)